MEQAQPIPIMKNNESNGVLYIFIHIYFSPKYLRFWLFVRTST